METGKLVWLMKGSPIYDDLDKIGGGTTRNYAGHITEVTMGIEVQREEGQDYPHNNGEKIRWSQVLVGGRLVWTRTVLLKRLDGAVGVGL